MPTRIKLPQRAAGLTRGWVELSGTITIGAAGAVSSSDGDAITVVKTGSEVGRYTLTLDRTYLKVRAQGAPGIVGPADTAFGNTDANAAQWRGIAASAVSTVQIQLFLASSGADTETTSGNVIHWSLLAKEQ